MLDREEKLYENAEQRGDMITIRKERPGDADGIRQVNEEAFMAMSLRDGALTGRGGVVRYLPEFRDV